MDDPSDVLNRIYFEYRKELLKEGLKESKATDMFNAIKKAQHKVITTTTDFNIDGSISETQEIKNKGNCDWLKQNPCMAKVCKRNGIKKSSELRDLIYQYWNY